MNDKNKQSEPTKPNPKPTPPPPPKPDPNITPPAYKGNYPKKDKKSQ